MALTVAANVQEDHQLLQHRNVSNLWNTFPAKGSRKARKVAGAITAKSIMEVADLLQYGVVVSVESFSVTQDEREIVFLNTISYVCDIQTYNIGLYHETVCMCVYVCGWVGVGGWDGTFITL